MKSCNALGLYVQVRREHCKDLANVPLSPLQINLHCRCCLQTLKPVSHGSAVLSGNVMLLDITCRVSSKKGVSSSSVVSPTLRTTAYGTPLRRTATSPAYLWFSTPARIT